MPQAINRCVIFTQLLKSSQQYDKLCSTLKRIKLLMGKYFSLQTFVWWKPFMNASIDYEIEESGLISLFVFVSRSNDVGVES